MKQRRLWISLAMVLALIVTGAGSTQAGDRAGDTEKADSCALKGTWYGFNNHGDDLVATFTRTGRGIYTVSIDYGVSLIPGTTGGTSWKGELVRIGGKKYQLTVMAFFPLEEGLGLPMGMGHCSITSKKLGCGLLRGKGSCAFSGFFHGQDPFTEGIPLAEPAPIKNLFRRMPSVDSESD